MVAERQVSVLEQLGRAHNAQKLNNDYLYRYARWLEPIRMDVTNVVEVGVWKGNSLRMWAEYFPRAVIHGFDIDPEAKAHEGERIHVAIVDSTDTDSAREYLEQIDGDIQVMVDDGSHHPFDQLATLKNLFPFLAHGGVYLLEDIGGSRGPLRQRALHGMTELVEGINYWPKSVAAYQAPYLGEFDIDNYWVNNVVGVSFYRYLAVIEKGHNPSDNPYLRGARPPTESPRPPLRGRLRELPWPRYRRRRHFIPRSEVRPERLPTQALRYLFGRW